MIKFNVETVPQCIEDVKTLVTEAWDEVEVYKDKMKLDPNYDLYLELEKLGVVHVVTVRDEGKLIGYYISLLMPNPHYQTHTFAINDLLFIHPDYRGGTTTYRMFKYAFKKLKEKGVSVITLNMKVKFPFKRLCKALGMEHHENVYTIYVGD